MNFQDFQESVLLEILGIRNLNFRPFWFSDTSLEWTIVLISQEEEDNMLWNWHCSFFSHFSEAKQPYIINVKNFKKRWYPCNISYKLFNRCRWFSWMFNVNAVSVQLRWNFRDNSNLEYFSFSFALPVLFKHV